MVAWAAVFGLDRLAAAADRTDSEAVLREIEASPRKEVARELVARARNAQQKATTYRSAGDEPRARLADDVARRWATAAMDAVRAAETESRATTARAAANDAGATADRERALLEEGIAQTGRMRAQLDSVVHDAKTIAPKTSGAAARDAGSNGSSTVDGGSR